MSHPKLKVNKTWDNFMFVRTSIMLVGMEMMMTTTTMMIIIINVIIYDQK